MARIVKQELETANEEANKMANLSSELNALSRAATDFYNSCRSSAEGQDVNYILEKLELLNEWSGGIKETSKELLNLSEAAANANNLILESWPISDATELSNKNIAELQNEINRLNNDIFRYNNTIRWYERLEWYKKIFSEKARETYHDALRNRDAAQTSLDAVIFTKKKVETFFETCNNVATSFDSATSNIVINSK